MCLQSLLRSSAALRTLCLASCISAICPAMAQSEAAATNDNDSIETVVVLGVRGAIEKAVSLKRNAVSIQDSIAAEDIGKLPDTTISDSLQRITGVQIDRSAGEGSSVNIRGLPQVGTMLNGEDFITAGSIVSVQPNFADIPSQLFAGADVVKSPTANILTGGITGTINLKTRRPLDLEDGWTGAASADTAHGFTSGKWQPEVNGLIGYHGSNWGILASVAYSDVTREDSTDGVDQYGGELFGEDADSATAYNGFLGAWNDAAVPDAITQLDSAGNVDVDGDGESNSAFYNSEDVAVLDRNIERKRLGLNVSAQYAFGFGLTATFDFFYTDQKQYQRTAGYQLNSSSWLGATFVPLVARDTGVTVDGSYNTGGTTQEYYTTQVYKRWIGDISSYAEDEVTDTSSRNYNLLLDYKPGGNFSASLRGIYADAAQLEMNSYAQFTMNDGANWNSQGGDYDGTTTYHYPSSAGGDRTFNANGYAANTIAAVIDSRGDHLKITMDDDVLAAMASKSAWALKTIASENNYDRRTNMMILRGDAHYLVPGMDLMFDAGFRESRRNASNETFDLIAPVYAGDGASDEDGCYVTWKGADVVMDGSSINGACTAGDSAGYYTSNVYGGYSMDSSSLPTQLSSNIKKYKNISGVKGISFYALNPKAMDNPRKFQESLYPGEIRDMDPAATWKVTVNQMSGYLQGSYEGDLFVPYSINAGVRIIHTDLTVTQHLVGDSQPYGMNALNAGTNVTKRGFTDYLPTVNLGFDLTDELKMRAAYSKNMQLLDLDTWSGGLTVYYGLDVKTGYYAALSGSQNGNPYLDPWRSSNYDLSFEYYLSKTGLINLAFFYIDVDSWIENKSDDRCDIPDVDGVIRRCVSITGPTQGRGKNLKGIEAGYRQGFDFLPGIWSNFGAELNFTYSPSNVGTDLAGHKIPFQDNSERQANMILWYQDAHFQVRLAGNYRSKRAVSTDYGGITGMEMYQAPTFYLDASASYDYNDHLQMFVQGTNILGEEEHYYLVWTDQKADTTRFEPRLTVGLRVKM